jgi:hypothetical protein
MGQGGFAGSGQTGEPQDGALVAVQLFPVRAVDIRFMPDGVLVGDL